MGEPKDVTRIGFWRSSAEPDLPMPVENPKPWGGQLLFLRNLRHLQAELTTTVYRGWSICRICRCRNGSAEYNYGGFVWPSGLEHYVDKHNVKVPDNFFRFIFKRWGRSDGKV